jgi:hypothetical protein
MKKKRGIKLIKKINQPIKRGPDIMTKSSRSHILK